VVNVTCSRLSATQVAGLCGVRPATVRRWARCGLLSPCPGKGPRRFRPEDVLTLFLDRFFKAARIA
jgi:DNA-binding transcriptional MerR regulator